MTAPRDWMTCDGRGRLGPRPEAPGPALERPTLSLRPSRRGWLVAAGMSLLSGFGLSPALAELAIESGKKPRPKRALVVIFLRGGLDALNAVIPYREDAYYRGRPTLAIAPPNRTGGAIDLDGFFGLNPSLEPLVGPYREGRLAIVHAVGSDDRTRSHFEAMAQMEKGQARSGASVSSGWIARFLTATEGENPSPIRAIAFSDVMPDSLRGYLRATALRSLDDLRLEVPGEWKEHFDLALRTLYAEGGDAVREAGRETLAVLDAIGSLDWASTSPEHGARYPDTPLGQGLRQVAMLVRADVGLEVACLDRGGWDTHVGQNTGTFYREGLDDLARSLSAFLVDLGAESERVTVVVMSEFGRRLRENASFGTDHGRGGLMLVAGGGVRGGRVYGDWPGLEPDQLEPPGDLRVTTDYRQVLGEMLEAGWSCPVGETIFPGLVLRPLGAFAR